MKKNLWIPCAILAVCGFCGLGQRQTFSTDVETVAEEIKSTVEYTFEDEQELDDFTAVYVPTESGTNGTIGEIEDYFTFDSIGGKITSKRTGTGTGSTGEITSLVLNKYTFTNFRAEIVMDFSGDSSWGWGGLQFRKTQLNTGWRANGCFGFVQKEGHATIWGSDAFDDTTIEQKATGAFSKNDKFLLSVSAIGKDCTVSVSSTDKKVTYAVNEYTFKKDESVVDGFLALQSVDNSHNFYSFKVTNLDENGNETALVESKGFGEIVLDDSVSSIKVGEPTKLVYDAGADIDENTLAWSLSDDSVAIVKNGWVTGLKEGETMVTVSSILNPTVKDSVTLTIAGASDDAYVFDNDDDIQAFTPSYVAFKSDPNGGDEAFSAHWMKTENGTIKRMNLTTSNANDENFAYLYLKDQTRTNFEATLVYRNTNAEYGWIGVASGAKSYSERCIDQGLGCFLQKEGHATVWGGSIELAEVKNSAYDASVWHTLRVRVYGKTVEIFVDDMGSPILKKTYGKNFTEGYVGIMTTCKAAFEISSFTVKTLNETGKVVDFSGIEKIAFAEKIETAKVGEKMNISLSVTGESELQPTFEYICSDTNVAFVNNNVLYFISDGTVTVTAVCPMDKRLTDTFTVTVEKDSTVEKDYYYIENDVNDGDGSEDNSNPSVGQDDKSEENGCGSNVLAAGMPTLAFVAVAAVARRRKRV